MKRILLALMFLASAISPALATNCSSYPYTLTNGSTADANQVMANFNLILNCANNNLAHNGANGDITSLSGLTTPLSVGQGGTGSATTPGGLTNLGAGAAAVENLGSNVVDDGSGNLGVIHGAQVFTGSGTFTAPAGVVATTTFKIVAIAGGGGGGGATSFTGAEAGAGGGGSGGVAVGFFSGLVSTNTLSVVVGAGGSAGTTSGSAGGTGGSSTVSFGATTIVTAAGGAGGGGSTGLSSNTLGGAPGSVTISAGSSGLTLIAALLGAGLPGETGQGGQQQFYTRAIGGMGGGNAYGTPGNAVLDTGAGSKAGNAGVSGGGGGGGALGYASTSAQAGGAGAAGEVIITW